MFDSTYYQKSDALKDLQSNATNPLNIATQTAFTNSSYLAAAQQLAFNCHNNSAMNVMPPFFPNHNMLASNFFGTQNFAEISTTPTLNSVNNLNLINNSIESNSETCKPSTASNDYQKPISSPTVRSTNNEIVNTGLNFPSDFLIPESSNGVKIELANRDLWLSFHKITNEMVVNKPGRKMFPKIEIKLTGLDSKRKYFMTLAMRPVDNFKYKFQSGSWSPAGQDVIPEWSNYVTHHEGPTGSGEFWMRNSVSFDRVKLTNKPHSEGSQISLVSMHKYQPVIALYIVNGPSQPIYIFQPDDLEFIAVTAYQSQEIINLKILHNPFAKGFREGSARKRSYSISPNSRHSSNNSSDSPPLAKNFAFPNPIAPNNFFPVLPNFSTVQPTYNTMFPFYPTPSMQYTNYAHNSASQFNSYFNGLINGNAFQPTRSDTTAMNAALQNQSSSQLMAAAFSNSATAAATLAMLSANSVSNNVTSTTSSISTTTLNPFTQAAAAMAAVVTAPPPLPSSTLNNTNSLPTNSESTLTTQSSSNNITSDSLLTKNLVPT